MARILIDTALLAIPNYADVGSDADELIDRISHFAQLALPEVPITMATMDNISDILWGGGIGPDYESIRDFLEMMGLAETYSAQDVFQQYAYLMDATAKVSSLCSILVTSCPNVLVEPNLPDPLFPFALTIETQKVLAQIAVEYSAGGTWFYGSSLCNHKICEYMVSAEIDDAQGLNGNICPTLPISVKAPVRTFENIQDIISSQLAEELWSQAENDTELSFAITLGAIAMRRASGKSCNLRDLEDFRIGECFIQSLKSNQAFSNAKFSATVGRICMELVAGIFAGHIGTFGKPDQEVRAADGALGFRVHVSGAGVALRLMFWRSTKHIEFANVGPKHEVKIDVGYPIKEPHVDLLEIL